MSGHFYAEELYLVNDRDTATVHTKTVVGGASELYWHHRTLFDIYSKMVAETPALEYFNVSFNRVSCADQTEIICKR